MLEQSACRGLKTGRAKQRGQKGLKTCREKVQTRAEGRSAGQAENSQARRCWMFKFGQSGGAPNKRKVQRRHTA